MKKFHRQGFCNGWAETKDKIELEMSVLEKKLR